jgi:hypothetical protein
MQIGKKVLAAAAGVLLVTAGMAQVQLNASASYLKGTGDNKASLWGGGLGAKFFLGDNVALGGALHTYPKKTYAVKTSTANYTEADLITNLGASVDFLLSKKSAPVQPYIGTDAGVSFNNHTVTYINETTQAVENKNSKTYFLLSPKAGVNIGLGQSFGIFGQAQYNFTFGNGETVSIDDVPNPFTTTPVTQFLSFDAGIYFRLQGAK